jgi:uncharacterized membrane protein
MMDDFQESLIGYIFNSPDDANELLESSQDEPRILIDDVIGGVVLEWPEHKQKPSIIQIDEISDSVLIDNAFWGMLFGLAFYIPELGVATAAAAGSLTGVFAKCGISRRFLQSVRDSVKQDTSALFLITNLAVMDNVSKLVGKSGKNFQIISTAISKVELVGLINDFGT